jgi:hypothetical protein
MQLISQKGERSFAPNSANHCENLSLEMQSFAIAEQHRANCHESDAVSGNLGSVGSLAPLIAEHDVEKRTEDFKLAIVANEAEFSELVHEEIDWGRGSRFWQG